MRRQVVQAVAHQVPGRGVQADDLAVLGGVGGRDEFVVQDGGGGRALGADGGVAVNHEQQVGVGFLDELEGNRLAVGAIGLHVRGGRNAQDIVDQAEPGAGAVGGRLAAGGQHDQALAGIGRLGLGGVDLLVDLRELPGNGIFLAEDPAQGGGLLGEGLHRLCLVDGQVDGRGDLGEFGVGGRGASGDDDQVRVAGGDGLEVRLLHGTDLGVAGAGVLGEGLRKLGVRHAISLEAQRVHAVQHAQVEDEHGFRVDRDVLGGALGVFHGNGGSGAGRVAGGCSGLSATGGQGEQGGAGGGAAKGGTQGKSSQSQLRDDTNDGMPTD